MLGLRRGIVLWLAASVALAACAEPRSPRCKRLCAREAECVEAADNTETAFDEGDCVAQCSALERDEQGRGTVERHADCVTAAGTSCTAVLACD